MKHKCESCGTGEFEVFEQFAQHMHENHVSIDRVRLRFDEVRDAFQAVFTLGDAQSFLDVSVKI